CPRRTNAATVASSSTYRRYQKVYSPTLVKAFVTGGAGFIGSTLTDRLISAGHDVVVYDNFSTGKDEFLREALASGRVTVTRGDVLDQSLLTSSMRGCDTVFHIAANADVRYGLQNPRRDVDQNTLATFHVLEAMRANGIDRIVFSSTGSIYGEPAVFPTPEDAPFPVQTSLYGASKLAGEGLISAYCEGYGFRGFIFRFVSILGERYSHGHVFDFVRSLRADPTRLTVLGNGKQRKSYLYVGDCVDAMLRGLDQATGRVNIFNLGADEYCEVTDSVGWICDRMGVRPQIEFTGGERGWIGDSPFIFLDCTRLRSLGWKPTLSIREGVIRTVDFLQAHPWLLEARP
ncbi:MAG TPA: NAD-dependent epimerase/dehydratase family protein, partial [Thermoanaerobaculia bacterium]|nr:NAD-dependent epimerase/dehydratase family protein [Thermoanaerobaculia bacterium]